MIMQKDQKHALITKIFMKNCEIFFTIYCCSEQFQYWLEAVYFVLKYTTWKIFAQVWLGSKVSMAYIQATVNIKQHIVETEDIKDG